MMNFGYASYFGFGWIFMIFWWVFIIVLIAVFIRWIFGQSRDVCNCKKLDSKTNKEPLEILKERYVKGEINKKEFDEIKKDLV